MPHILLHIGPHKTGSSHLQTCLSANSEALEKAGIHLASQWAGSTIKPSHTGLVERLNSERRHEIQPVFDRWRRSAYRKIVISCEDLDSISREPVKVQMLRELTEGCPVSIVYYVRRWSERLASVWQEYVKQGSTHQLPEVLVHNLRDPWQSPIINIDMCLRVFADKFGTPSIRLVSYDSVVASGRDMFHHFCSAFLDGIDLPVPVTGIVNPSLPPAAVEMLRVFNILQQQTGVDSSYLVRFLTMTHKPAPLTALLAHLHHFASTIEVKDDDQAVRQTLLANRLDYGICTVDPVDAAWFYPPKTTQLRFIGTGYALTPGFAEAARKLWQDLLAIDSPRRQA